MRTLKGTEKQVKFANDLLGKLEGRLSTIIGTPREKKWAVEIELLNHVSDGIDAGKVIDIFNTDGNFEYSARLVSKGLVPIEKAINYLKS